MSYLGKAVGQSLATTGLELKSGTLTVDATAANAGALQSKYVHKATVKAAAANRYGETVFDVQDAAGNNLYDIALEGNHSSDGGSLRFNAVNDAGTSSVAFDIDRATAKVDFASGLAGAIEGAGASDGTYTNNANVTLSGADLLAGAVVLNDDGAGNVAYTVTLPTAADLVSALEAQNITPAAGTILHMPVYLKATGGTNSIAVDDAATGATYVGASIQDGSAAARVVFTGAAAYSLVA